MSERSLERPLDRFTRKYLPRPSQISTFVARARRRRPYKAGMENIVGTAIEEKVARGRPTGELSLKVYVVKKLAQDKITPESIIPYKFDGIITDVEETGTILAQGDDPRCYDLVRPGCSIGHVEISHGSLGCMVGDRHGQYILSNNHVMANSNDARRGDFILQPGRFHLGRHIQASHPQAKCRAGDKCIASLSRFKRIDFGGRSNNIDAAIARPIRGGRRLNPSIISIGRVRGTVTARRDMKVKKRGARTLFTTGKITSVRTNIDINYGTLQNPIYARFVGQIAFQGSGGRFSDSGDSGSLIVDQRKRATALLFAGTSNGSRTFANPIELVLQAFGVRII